MPHAASRLCALALAVALVAAPAVGTLGRAPGCVSCAPDCPMHAHRVGCHQARQPSCHHGAGSGLRAGCGHHAERGVEAIAWRAVVPATTGGTPSAVVGSVAVRPIAAPPDPFREPPTDPPRALVG